MNLVEQLEAKVRTCLSHNDEAGARQAIIDAFPTLPEDVRGRLLVTFLEFGLGELDAANTLHNMQVAALDILAAAGDTDAASE